MPTELAYVAFRRCLGLVGLGGSSMEATGSRRPTPELGHPLTAVTNSRLAQMSRSVERCRRWAGGLRRAPDDFE